MIMEKISKSQIKLVRSLQMKKFRDETGLFVAEGEKCVEELRKGFEVEYYIQTAGADRPATPDRTQTGLRPDRVLLATPKEIEQMSGLRTPQGVIGVFRKNASDDRPATPDRGQTADADRPACGLTDAKRAIERKTADKQDIILVLDGVQDPGNLGTIIRTCDWFGVHEIVCSKDTADCYNPKVVQATMGALARVRVHYTDLVEWLSPTRPPHEGEEKVRIYGTLLEGENMYEVLGNGGLINGDASLNGGLMPQVIIMGNEGNGISAEVRKLITHPIRIPSYPPNGASGKNGKNAERSEVVESLNVSIATAIVLAEFRRENK